MIIEGVNKQSAVVLTKSEILEIHAKNTKFNQIFVSVDISAVPVSIAPHYGLNGLGIESRWGQDFSHPSRLSPGAHPASYTMGNRSFNGVRQPVCGFDHSPSYSVEVKERVEIYLYSTLGLHGLLQGEFYLHLFTVKTSVRQEVQLVPSNTALLPNYVIKHTVHFK